MGRAIQCVRKNDILTDLLEGLWGWKSWFFANTLMLVPDVVNKMCWWWIFVTDMALLITNISWNSVTNMLKSSPTLSHQHNVIYCQPILYHWIDYAFPIAFTKPFWFKCIRFWLRRARGRYTSCKKSRNAITCCEWKILYQRIFWFKLRPSYTTMGQIVYGRSLKLHIS